MTVSTNKLLWNWAMPANTQPSTNGPIFNVITSLARFDNAKILLKHLAPHRIVWHVIMDDDNGCSLKFDDQWVKTYLCPNKDTEFWARCHNALNWFLDTQEIKDNEMYCFMNDDDGYEPNFFQKIRETMAEVERENGSEPDVMIVSMKRGDNIPVVEPHRIAHHTTFLPAHPDNVRIGCIGLEQFIVRGKIIKNYRFPHDICADGMLIMKLFKENGAVFAPYINALFNYFEPGRWNK